MLKYGLLAILIIAAWWPSLRAPWIFDDDTAVYKNPSVDFHRPIYLDHPRPFTTLTYRLNYMVGQENPFGYHLVNLGIHLINVGLILWFLTPYLGSFAFVAAGIFGLHPLQSEAVTYVSARTELLMTMFCLLALILARRGRWLLALGCCLFSILSKESGIVSILLVILLLGSENRISPRKAIVFLCLAAVFGGILHWQADFTNSGRSLLEHDLILNAQLWGYFMMLVYPVGLSIDHDPESIPFGLVLIAAVVSMVALYLSLTSQGLLRIAEWIVITLLPRFLVNVPEYLTEHHLYLPFVGISALCAVAIHKLLEWRETYLEQYQRT